VEILYHSNAELLALSRVWGSDVEQGFACKDACERLRMGDAFSHDPHVGSRLLDRPFDTLSISNRGAPLEIAEHTREGYIAGANQGVGAIESDVMFTSYRELVCRHSLC
jgi:hypothetical protein